MRKLGEQWVEEIDDVKHMLKAMENTTGKCKGCDLQVIDNCYGVCGASDGCNFIIKDLGVLNEDGLLPCPFCGEYPKIIYPTENMPVVSIVHTGGGHRVLLEFFRNKQEAIDAWNSRA